MARERSPNRDKAFTLYKEHKGNILLKDIASMLGVKDTQIRKWKSQDKWEDKLKGTLPNTNNNKRNVTNKKIIKKRDTEENTDLTEKQKLFCIHYIENFNATKAYQKAYECNYNTAKAHGCKLLRKVAVKQEIDRLTTECLEEQEIDSKLLSKRLIQKYINIAFSDITDYLTFGQLEKQGEFGTYKVNHIDLKNSNEVDGSLISEISQGKDGIKIKMQDKMKALQWLSDRTNLLSDKDKSRLDIELLKLDMEMNKIDNSDEKIEEDGFIEALNKTAEEVWDDE